MKLTALALFLTLPMLAGDSPWSFGVQGSLNKATSPVLKEITNDQFGLGGGLNVTYKFAANQAVRVRADYTAFPTHLTKYSNVYTLSTKANTITSEADYLLYVKKNWYLTAGAGVSHWQNQYHGYYAKYFGRMDVLQDASVTQPLVTAGTGYEIPFNKIWFKKITFEARYLDTQLSTSAKSNSVQAGVMVSF
jgi:hypothetical protein